MKKIYSVMLPFLFVASHAQNMEMKIVPGWGSRIYDISNGGKGIIGSGDYDYSTNTVTVTENGEGTNRMNVQGDVAGLVSYVDANGEELGQAGYRHNGVWNAIGYFAGDTPGNSWFSDANDISSNGLYVTGQISSSVSNSYAFLYNTSTGTLVKYASDDTFEYGRGEAVNSSGIVAGFINRYSINGSTFWLPAYYTTDGKYHLINFDESNPQSGEASDINDSGLVVGSQGYKPFTYNINTGEFKSLLPPSGYSSAVFVAVSDDGTAVGYAGDIGARDVIIYNPKLGNNPVLLKDILTANGVEIGTSDGKLGTGMGISPDGNFVGGFDNTIPPIFASGWAVNLNGNLISDNDCKLVVPDNIVTSVDQIDQQTKIVNYEVSISCGSGSSDGLQMVKVEGPDSGAAFPLGTTNIVYHLVDANGKILYVGSFSVTVNDYYCTISPAYYIDNISKVVFAGIDNASDIYGTTPNEYYLDQKAEVEQGKTYPIAIEANNYGVESDYVTAFIDWNQNGLFTDEGEVYELGAIVSTGEDGVQLTGNIAVPEDAKTGLTRMRVLINWGNAITDACDASTFGYGSTEDYLVNVSENLGVNDATRNSFSYYPNPVTDVMNVSSTDMMKDISIYDAAGKLVKGFATDSKKSEINLGNLPSGVYVGKVTFENGHVKTIKIIKK
ncbi:GEVED domain-containing protein [Daejeonia sp. YH14]|uniref:GEVED domain-containing protein n=1 Tax=Daejeonia sp. YH14 TaxID=3439042 RepID=UPI003F49AB02